MAYSHADDVDQNANRGEKSEEVFLHHNLTRFRKHHRHAESPHGQQIGGDVLHGQLIGDMEEHLSMLLGFGCLQTEPIANSAHGLQVWDIFPVRN